MDPFKVIVAGGREFDDYALLCAKLDHLLGRIAKERGIIIISGGAKGADSLEERYAQERGHTLERYPAEWDLHGKKAGVILNQFLAHISGGLVAFWDGESRGTADMIRPAKEKGIPICIVRC